jgi:hypothetical protein
MNSIIFDTNVFDMIMSGTLEKKIIGDSVVVATHVQRDELNAIPDPIRKQKLLDVFGKTTKEIVATTVAIWGTSNWGESKFGTDEQNSLFEKMRNELIRLDKKAKSQILNQTRDILIAVTSIEEKIHLITTDKKLSEVVKSNGGSASWIKKTN